jgi:hypothetical protein
MSESKLVKDIVKQIERIAEKLQIEPYQLKKAQFMEFSQIDDWSLRKIGGYQTLLNTYFPVPDKNLKDIQLLKQRKSYVSKLEKRYGTWEAFQEQLTESLVRTLSQIKVEPKILNEKATRDYIKSVEKTELHDSSPRSICVALTDLHFGTNVDSAELGGKNEFNWTIGARRLKPIRWNFVSYTKKLFFFWVGI